MSYDIELNSSLKSLVKAPTITINREQTLKLITGQPISIKFDYKPMFGSNKLVISQGANSITLKVAKDRYHNDNEFTLYTVDSNLDYDLYLRRSQPKIESVKEVQEMSSCMDDRIVGFKNGAVIKESKPGTQMVLNRYTTTSSNYTLQFVKNNYAEALASQQFISKKSEVLKELSLCVRSDLSLSVHQ